MSINMKRYLVPLTTTEVQLINCGTSLPGRPQQWVTHNAGDGVGKRASHVVSGRVNRHGFFGNATQN